MRGQRIAEIQKLISDKIAENMVVEMENKVKMVSWRNGKMIKAPNIGHGQDWSKNNL